MPQKFLAIFCRADSAHPSEHACKVLLRFEAAGHRDVQDARLGRAQHLLRALYPLTQNKVMRALARRLAKHPREMSSAQLHRLLHLRLPLAPCPKWRCTNSASLRFETISPNDEGPGSFRPYRRYVLPSQNGAGPFQWNHAATPWREPADPSPTCAAL